MHQLKPFAAQRSLEIDEAGDVAARTYQVRDESTADRIGHARKHNRYRVGLRLQRAVAGVVTERSTSGFSRTNSFANTCVRSMLPALQR